MVGTWLALTLMLAQPGMDAVVLKNGERVEGVVLEASPSKGVTLSLPDGGRRWFHPMAVERIERAGGAPQVLDEPAAPPPPPPQAVEPPRYVEPPRQEEPPRQAEPPRYVEPRYAEPPRFVDTRPVEAQPLPPTDAPPRAAAWFAISSASATPYGASGRNAPSLQDLVGDDNSQLSLEYGIRVNARDSVGAVVDFSFGGVGRDLAPVCARYGTDCSTATAQLGLFLRRDFAPFSQLNPWASFGMAREWLAGEVFSPYAGGESVPVLSAPGWQFARLGAGLDWRASRWFGLGLYGTLALGAYDRVTIDGVDVDDGSAVHGWAQVGLRAIFGP